MRLAEIRTWVDPTEPSTPGTRTGRDLVVDAGACLLAVVLGALFLSPTLRSGAVMSTRQVVVDVACGALACLLLWWRRRWPVGVAVVCVAVGAVSISATAPGLVALFSLAVHRPARPALVVAALFVPAGLVFAAYSATTDPLSVVLVVTPITLAAVAWGMFVRARRQLLLSLRERAQRAEADQRLREDRARMAERTRIAREMHDVLGHRISLVALHAGGLELQPDLPPEQVRETAALLSATARLALEELRGVIGVLRDQPGLDPPPQAPQPTLSDIGRLVDERRLAGAKIDLELRVSHADAVPAALGRDAYRIVQEALTNVAKHAPGTSTRVRVTGDPERGLHVSIRNRQPLQVSIGSALPGSGTGLVGLGERVALGGGTLVHGPNGSGDFVVEAELQWPR